MRIAVGSEAAALALIAQIEAKTQDFRPFWARLQAGPFGTGGAARGKLADYMQARWDRRFDLGLTHAESTIEDRRERTEGTYYGDVGPGRRAKPDAPYLEWSGSLRAAASGFTQFDRLRAEIDPARNYRGPLESVGGWDATGAKYLTDDALFKPAEFDAMLERELEAWIAEEYTP